MIKIRKQCLTLLLGMIASSSNMVFAKDLDVTTNASFEQVVGDKLQFIAQNTCQSENNMVNDNEAWENYNPIDNTYMLVTYPDDSQSNFSLFDEDYFIPLISKKKIPLKIAALAKSATKSFYRESFEEKLMGEKPVLEEASMMNKGYPKKLMLVRKRQLNHVL